MSYKEELLTIVLADFFYRQMPVLLLNQLHQSTEN